MDLTQSAPLHLNILYVDDDLDDVFFFRQALEKLDLTFTFQTANNCMDLIGLLNDESSTTFDIIFLDINLPVNDGHSCLRRIKSFEKHSHIPVIIFSGSHNQEDVNQAYEAG